MRKQSIAGFMAAGMAALMLAGCSTQSTQETTAASETGAETKAESEASEAESEARDEAGGTLRVVATSEDYVTLFDKFTQETGIETELLSMSSGEVLSKVKAEGGTPMADLWFGGGIDAFMGAKEDGLLQQVNFDEAANLAPEYKDADNYWFAKGITVVGFVVNNDIIEEKGLEIPKTWDDLTDPSYQGEVLMSNPAISGTNYAVVNALLQTKGEEEGWKYFEELNKNIEYCSDPVTKTVAGEFAIGIAPMDRAIDKMEEEQNITAVYPEDGIPYVPEGVAVFKNSEGAEAACEFIEWFYSDDENLKMVADIDNKDTIKMVKPDIEGMELTFDTEMLMDEDLSLFGSERENILAKWDELAGDKSENE